MSSPPRNNWQREFQSTIPVPVGAEGRSRFRKRFRDSPPSQPPQPMIARGHHGQGVGSAPVRAYEDLSQPSWRQDVIPTALRPRYRPSNKAWQGALLVLRAKVSECDIMSPAYNKLKRKNNTRSTCNKTKKLNLIPQNDSDTKHTTPAPKLNKNAQSEHPTSTQANMTQKPLYNIHTRNSYETLNDEDIDNMEQD
ncbi:hypothetical protein CBL_10503 [Carabus blaptoides fortunei]